MLAGESFVSAPSVLTVMTPFPVHTSADTPVIAAEAIMRGRDVRHLPVERDGSVIGVVSDADLRVARVLMDLPEMPVERLCTRPPLVVETDVPVRRLVTRMAEEGVDAAIVLRQGRLAGIVTLSDICDELLRHMPTPFGQEPPPSGGEAA